MSIRCVFSHIVVFMCGTSSFMCFHGIYYDVPPFLLERGTDLLKQQKAACHNIAAFLSQQKCWHFIILGTFHVILSLHRGSL